jgi:hypothetical protein
VGDDERRSVLEECLETLEDVGLGPLVQGRGGLVQDQHGRVPQQRASDGDALSLSARQRHPARAEDGVVAIRQVLHEGVRPGCRGRADHLLRPRPRPVGDVLGHGAGEQDGVLQDEADLGAQPPERAIGQVVAVDHDASRGRIVEACDERRHGGLARSRGAHEGHLSASGNVE